MANAYVDPRGWPIIDRLLAKMFSDLVTIGGQAVYAGTVLRDGQTWPAIRVQRLPGGGINDDGYQDVSRVEVTTWGRTRPESDDLTAQVRYLMHDLSCDEYAGVSVDIIREESGPGRVPDPDEDLRAVPTSWTVTARYQPRLAL
jgi:hypothetical protein